MTSADRLEARYLISESIGRLATHYHDATCPPPPFTGNSLLMTPDLLDVATDLTVHPGWLRAAGAPVGSRLLQQRGLSIRTMRSASSTPARPARSVSPTAGPASPCPDGHRRASIRRPLYTTLRLTSTAMLTRVGNAGPDGVLRSRPTRIGRLAAPNHRSARLHGARVIVSVMRHPRE